MTPTTQGYITSYAVTHIQVLH
ncbi:hypothetical protein, partial [Tropheryma whipplei]